MAVAGLTNVDAAGTSGGLSINIDGTTGDNTLHFPLTVPGQILFNGVLLHPLTSGGTVSGSIDLGAGLSRLQEQLPACDDSPPFLRVWGACRPPATFRMPAFEE